MAIWNTRAFRSRVRSDGLAASQAIVFKLSPGVEYFHQQMLSKRTQVLPKDQWEVTVQPLSVCQCYCARAQGWRVGLLACSVCLVTRTQCRDKVASGLPLDWRCDVSVGSVLSAPTYPSWQAAELSQVTACQFVSRRLGDDLPWNVPAHIDKY
jgi:hypothetical protein